MRLNRRLPSKKSTGMGQVLRATQFQSFHGIVGNGMKNESVCVREKEREREKKESSNERHVDYLSHRRTPAAE